MLSIKYSVLMKVVVYGGFGWIGNKICNLLKESNHEILVSSKRTDQIEDIEEEVKTFAPTHIVCCIGRTHGTYNGKKYTTIDYLEQPGTIKENVRDNLFSPIVLALLSKKYNFHLTYLGTGCIFKYADDHLFNENDKPNFFGSSYSVVKGYTDQLMHMFSSNVLNVRIRMPITDEVHPRNFITKITNYEYICSIPNSMTVLTELLPIMIDMMQNQTTGTINLTNPGVISHNEILEMYKEIIDPNFTWKNFSAEEQKKILAADRSNNHLDTTKLETMYPNVLNIKQSVKNVLMNMKNNMYSNQ
jgi:3,5-epimerase/4-reductase